MTRLPLRSISATTSAAVVSALKGVRTGVLTFMLDSRVSGDADPRRTC
jgi:alkyl hydroperoxide reductase subunit AhpF